MVGTENVNSAPVQRGVVVGSLIEGQPRHVITIHTDGSISGLRAGDGKGVDMRELGKTDMMRVSEIELDFNSQMYIIRFLMGTQAGDYMKWRDMFRAFPHLKDGPNKDGNDYRDQKPDQIVSFRTYELAVEAEVAYFNAARLAGEGVKL